MNTEVESKFIPVLKCPRRHWTIPRIDEFSRLKEQQRQEEAVQLLIAGTTPQGRELFRKILFKAEHLLEYEDILTVWKIIDIEFNKFEALGAEFKILFHRCLAGKPPIQEISLSEIATIVVSRAHEIRRLTASQIGWKQ